MYKQIKRTVIILILSSGFWACLCSDVLPKWNIIDFDVFIYDKHNSPPDNGKIEGDSIKLLVSFNPEFVASRLAPAFSFMSIAYATSCPEPGREGLKDPISDIIISSNAPFNAFDAGESLNSIIKVYGVSSIEEWISNAMDWSYEIYQEMRLVVTERPLSSPIHKFKVNIEFESGKVLEVESEEIQWNQTWCC